MSRKDGVLESNIKTMDVKEAVTEAARIHKVPLEEVGFTLHQCSEPKRSANQFYREYLLDVFLKGLYPVTLKYSIQQRVKDGRKEAFLLVDSSSEIDTSIATPLEVLTEIKKILAWEGIVFGIIGDELLYAIAVQIFDSIKDSRPACPDPFLVARGQSPSSSEMPSPVQYHFDRHGGVAKAKAEGETFLVREGELLVTEPIIDNSMLFITPHGSIVLPGNQTQVVFDSISDGIRKEQVAGEVRYFAEHEGYLSIEDRVLILRGSKRNMTPAAQPVEAPAAPETEPAAVTQPKAVEPVTQDTVVAESEPATARKSGTDMRKLSDAQKTLLKIKKLFSIFEGLTNEGLLLVTSEARIVRYKKFDLIFEQGSAGKEIYFIINGSVDVMVGKRRDIGNLERYVDHFTASRLTQGCFFGEMAPISGERRSARCICSSGEAVLLQFKIVERVNANNAMQMAILYRNFVKALAAKLKSSNEAIVNS